MGRTRQEWQPVYVRNDRKTDGHAENRSDQGTVESERPMEPLGLATFRKWVRIKGPENRSRRLQVIAAIRRLLVTNCHQGAPISVFGVTILGFHCFSAVTREPRRDFPLPWPLGEDLALLLSHILLCRFRASCPREPMVAEV
jgi:hypothetical protein